MSKSKPMAFPWQRPCCYFSVNTFIIGHGLLTGRWTISEEDTNNDGQPDVQTTRTLDEHGRVTKAEFIDRNAPQNNKTVVVEYDRLGRVTRLEYQSQVRPNTTVYEYDIRDRLMKETSTTKISDTVSSTVIANHQLGAGGFIASTTVKDSSGKLREVRQFTKFGMPKSTVNYDDSGRVFQEEQIHYDRHQRETRRQIRQFNFHDASNQNRLIRETIEETVYRANSLRPVSFSGTEHQEVEPTPGQFRWIIAEQVTTTYPPKGIGIERFERRSYSPTVSGDPVEFAHRVTETRYDDQRRTVEIVDTNSNTQTGESKTAKTRYFYGLINITTVDMGQDGVVDEENISVVDEQGRVVSSRDGAPDDGPFKNRQTLRYNDDGELSERRIYENDSTKPARVIRFR